MTHNHRESKFREKEQMHSQREYEFRKGVETENKRTGERVRGERVSVNLE